MGSWSGERLAPHRWLAPGPRSAPAPRSEERQRPLRSEERFARCGVVSRPEIVEVGSGTRSREGLRTPPKSEEMPQQPLPTPPSSPIHVANVPQADWIPPLRRSPRPYGSSNGAASPARSPEVGEPLTQTLSVEQVEDSEPEPASQPILLGMSPVAVEEPDDVAQASDLPIPMLMPEPVLEEVPVPAPISQANEPQPGAPVPIIVPSFIEPQEPARSSTPMPSLSSRKRAHRISVDFYL
ncbi:hypothetical protein CC80DRAFT_196222 [Byssothecium circinans]|uniref:Uncharacterized protein n=1 Tax=Byssothecium circinans TaxID=147558 RepID=A0A6A5UKU3_9PLEO|nr:hypothetical protein CC80DRAFT_196222 [Byssothecium circinans]